MFRAAMTLLIASSSVPAMSGARQQAVVTTPEDPAARKSGADLGYAEAIVSDGTAYLSGVVAAVRAGDVGFEPAYERAFDRIGAAL